MSDYVFDPQVAEIATELEALHGKITELIGQNQRWEDPQYRLFSGARRSVRDALKTLREDAFGMAWGYLKEHHGLRNAEDDSRAKRELSEKFMEGPGLDFGPLKEYFGELEAEADRLALETILKNARPSLPYVSTWEGGWDGDPQKLVHKSTVRLDLWRDPYSGRERLSMDAQGVLGALDQLGCVFVFGVRPSRARSGWLSYVYWNDRESHSGKRIPGGPFASCQSFKNRRFDLTFETPEEAMGFAELLASRD